MKFRTILLLMMIIISLFQNILRSQDFQDYYQFTDSMDAYYKAYPELTAEPEGDSLQYLRYKLFWKDRVYGNDSVREGSPKVWLEALERYKNEQDQFRQTPIGSFWYQNGPEGLSEQLSGLISSVFVDTIFDKSLNTIYIGTNASGIWKTTDGGSNWANITDFMGFPNLGITQIIGDPNNPGVIYASTGGHKMLRPDIVGGYGLGIIKSNNHGSTWSQFLGYIPHDCHVVYKMMIDPANSQRMYALVDDVVVRTQNGGMAWDTIFQSLTPHQFPDDKKYLRDIEMHPTNNDILYIASDDCGLGRGTAIAEAWKTTNATATDPQWQRIDTCLLQQVVDSIQQTTERYEIEVSKKDPNAVWISCTDLLTLPKKGKIWKSYDSGNTWALKFNESIDGFDYHRPGMRISPVDTGRIYVFGIWAGILKNWEKDSMAIYTGHIDNRATFILNRSGALLNDTIFVGNDGGISRSYNSGLAYENINGENLVMTQFWGIGGSQKAPYQIFGGTQDNNLYRLQNNVWTNLGYADFGDIAVASDSSNIIFADKWNCGTGGAGIVVSVNSGINFKWEVNKFMYEADAITNQPIVSNPQNPLSAITGVHHLYKLLIHGDTLSQSKINVPGNIDPADVIKQICIAPHDTNVIYVAFDEPEWNQSSPIRKLIRTKDHGVTWNVISDSLDVLRGHSITGIAVNPENPDSLWITLGGFTYWYQPGTMNSKVLFSPDAGSNWQDISNGLPDMPVNCIKYKKGGKGSLFVGTDVGVFYRDLANATWVPFRNNLPQCIVMDLEINDSIGRIRAGTFGRGLWETDISCPFSTEPLVITGEEQWDHDTIMDRSIVIDSLAILTIKSKVSMPQASKIYVKPGGKLIVDGGILTNACLDFWQGIEVWGNPELSPYPPTNQGYVYLINNAIIEHARIAVATCSTDSIGRVQWNTTGGIIVSDNAVFQDNIKAVALLSYPMNQVSNFRRTLFQTTMKNLDGDNPTDFVSLYDVEGVRFLGCTFRNISDSLGHVAGKSNGRGIYAINSQFYVVPWCTGSIQPCPADELLPNVFQNLHYGIKQFNYSPTELTVIDSAKFIDTYRGVYMSGSDFASITSNEFKIPKFNVSPNNELDTCYGLYLGNCTSYHVENNRFYVNNNVLLQPNQTQRIREIGIIVDNSGGKPNEIYRNRFDSLDLAINAQRVNRDDDEKTGLVIKCNTYHNNSYDEMITRENENIVEGIAINQGYMVPDSAHTLCGNTFSPYHDSAQIAETDIKNTGDMIFYCHHIERPLQNSLRVEPEFYTDGLVERQQGGYYYDSTTCCLSKIIQQGSIAEVCQLMEIESNRIESLTNSYEQVIDGGDSELLQDDIFFSSPEDAFQLHQELLGESPYLSDTVIMMSIAKEEVLPNAMIRDVMVANPQSAKSAELMHQLTNRIQPMPEPLMEEILAGREFLSPRELLEAQLTQHKAVKLSLLNTLMRRYKADTFSYSDSIISLLQNEKNLDAKYQLAMEHIKNGDTTQAMIVVSNISSSFSLTDTQIKQNQNYNDYIDILSKLFITNKRIYDLTVSEKFKISSLMNSSVEPICTYARNILIANNALDYSEPILFPELTKSVQGNRSYKTSRIKPLSHMSINPNPAQNYITVEYFIENAGTKINDNKFVIYLSSGRIMDVLKYKKHQDLIIINTSEYQNGQYICTMYHGGKFILSQKFIVLK